MSLLSQKSHCLFASLLLLLGGCGLYDGLTGTPVESDAGGQLNPDGGLDDGGDFDENACGGRGPLYFDGEQAEPGDGCGVCGDGMLQCEGAEQLSCVQPTVANECGGCEPLPAPAGDACGPCGDGLWECDDSGGLECVDATSPVNDCEGCNTLVGEPKWVCVNDQGEQGMWRCAGPEEVYCALPDENACGGVAELSDTPGEPCGECGKGVWACEAANEVSCQHAQRGVNACGGCDTLYGVVGHPCGKCGGVWACDGENDVYCDESEADGCDQ